MPVKKRECSDDIYERLTRVEVQTGAISQDMSEVKESLKEISSSLRILSVLDVKHNNTVESLNRAFKEIDVLKKQILEAEKKLPNLLLASSWVFKAVLGVLGLFGVAAVGYMLKSWFGAN